MVTTIEQSVVLAAPWERLFETYVDPKLHSAMTGSQVKISSEPGAEFRAFSGMLSGRMLHADPAGLVVQTWRANHWPPEALDSVLTLRFFPEGETAGRIELAHVGVAESDYEGVREGWNNYYWIPWREYLEQL